MHPISRALPCLLILVFAVSGAHAFAPRQDAERELIPLPEGDAQIFDRFIRSDEFADAGLTEFRSRVGGNWAIQRKPLTGNISD